MKIAYEEYRNFKYCFEFEYHPAIVSFCKSIQSIYTWQEFYWLGGKWRFNNPSIIFNIQQKYEGIIIDDKVIKSIEAEEKRIQEAKEMEIIAEKIKSAETSSLTSIDGIKPEIVLREYQKLGVEFFLNSKGRGILADAPGTGKSLQSISYLAASGKKRTLIITPASLKYNWENEINKFSYLKAFVADSKTDFNKVPDDVQAVILNYDNLQKHLPVLLKIPWDCIICDEAHYVKEPKAARSKAVNLLSKHAESVILLTGTPLLSRPIELFHLLHLIDADTWNNYYSFATRYCDGKKGRFGYEAKGATNLDELRKKISRYFLRRTKDEVLKELPPKVYKTIPIVLDGKSKSEYKKASDEFALFLRDTKNKTKRQIMNTLKAEKLAKINYLRQISAMGKVESAREIIDSIIDSGEKIIVFCSFNDPINKLHDIYGEMAVKILGDVPARERQNAVDKFQNDDDVKIFFGGFESASEGITLTKSTNVLFIDYPWNPSKMLQAEDRSHRIGVKGESVNIYQLYAKGTLDSYMEQLLEKKRKIFDVLIDSERLERESGEDYVDELIQLIESDNK